MMIRKIIFGIVFIHSFSIVFAEDPCRFEHPEKGVIDITTLGRTDGQATYADRRPAKESGYKYSYNPCKPFSQGDACQNVAACQNSLDGKYSYPLGTQASATWTVGSAADESALVVYSDDIRKTIVILICSTTGSDQFEVLGEDPLSIYIFRLTHKCACWNGCSGITSTIAPTTTPSPTSDACRFVHPQNGIIDFSFIGRTDEKAAYSDENTRTVSDFKYSYNPCRSFSQGNGCIGAAVCQVSKDEKETFTLGTQESAWWDAGSDVNAVPSLNYVYADKKVTVLLQCSTEGNNEFQAYGEDPVNTYKFQFTHKCACWNECAM